MRRPDRAQDSAIRTVRELVEETATEKDILSITIVDVDQHPERAEQDNIITVPCLTIMVGEERKLFVGDISEKKAEIRRALLHQVK